MTTQTRIKVSAIQDPAPNNTVTVQKQLKESAEVAQRLRGDPGDSYVRVNELTQGGLWTLVNGVLIPTGISKVGGGNVVTADSIQGTGSSGSPVELVGDSASPGNSQLYGTNGSGTKGWYAQPSGGSSTLAGLSDVSISAPVNGQVLTYIASASKWENQTATGGSGMVLIGKSTATSAVASLTVSSIPATYTALQIVTYGRSTISGGTDMHMQFNGDTGSNYDTQNIQAIGGTLSGSDTIGAAYSIAGAFCDHTITRPGTSSIFMPGYTSTTFDKVGTGNSSLTFATGSNGNIIQTRYIVWRPSTPAAITSVTVAIATGNIDVGSFLAVYGIP